MGQGPHPLPPAHLLNGDFLPSPWVPNLVGFFGIPVVINTRQTLDYKIDAYTKTRGKMLNEEEMANPQNAYCTGVFLESKCLFWS